MNSMLDAFRMKPFDLEPVLAEWTDGPVFKGKKKKDPPVEEWLESIKAGCQERNIPEEYWYKVAQHFMGPKAKGRFEEVKKVVLTVNGGKYRWTWKKFKVAMTNMGWEIDETATETIKVRGSGSRMWFSRKGNEDKKDAASVASASSSRSSTISEAPKRPPPSRSNTLLGWTKKPMVDEPLEDLDEEPVLIERPKPKRSRTLLESAFFSAPRDDDEVAESSVNGVAPKPPPKEPKKKEKKEEPDARPKHQKARSETAITRPRSGSASESKALSKPKPNRSQTTDEHSGSGTDVTTIANAPIWLLNAVGALDYLTNEHPKAISVLSAILITVGSIPSIPAISAGAGGAILASSAAHAIGAVAVGLGQALGSQVKKSQGSTDDHH